MPQVRVNLEDGQALSPLNNVLPEDLLQNVCPHEMKVAQKVWEASFKVMSEGDGPVRDLAIHTNLLSEIDTRGEKHIYIFVPSLPRHVRRREDVGVNFEVDQETGHRSMLLSSLLSAKPFQLRVTHIETYQSICTACRHAFDYLGQWLSKMGAGESPTNEREKPERPTRNTATDDMPNAVVVHHDMYSLWAHAECQGCMTCARLLRIVRTRWRGVLQGPDNPTRCQIELCWERVTRKDERLVLYYVATIPSQPRRWEYTYFMMLKMCLWPMSTFSSSFDLELLLGGQKLLEDILAQDQPTSDFEASLTRAWLWRCPDNLDGKHPSCQALPSGYSPSRVLGVSYANRTGCLRLCCTR